MNIIFTEAFMEDFKLRDEYFSNFDYQEGTRLSYKLSKRLESTIQLLQVFPNIGHKAGSNRIISLAKKRNDSFRKVELHYSVKGEQIILLRLFHSTQNL